MGEVRTTKAKGLGLAKVNIYIFFWTTSYTREDNPVQEGLSEMGGSTTK